MTLHSIARESAARFLSAVGVPALARRRQRQRLAILMYHGVEAEPLSPACWHVLDTATLRRQLEYVRRHFQVLPLEEALDRLRTDTLPDNAAAITFDDGTQNLATNAAPVLHDLGLPAAFFLSTGPMGTVDTLWADKLWLAFARTTARIVDLSTVGHGNRSLITKSERAKAYALTIDRFKDLPDHERLQQLQSLMAKLAPSDDGDPGPFRMLSWDEALELEAADLVTIYPHTVTHPILSRCDDEKVEHEIGGSCTAFENHTGRPPAIFAYPNGRAQDFDERAKDALRRQKIQWALSTTRGFADRDSDPLALPRLGIGSNQSFQEFQLLVSGALP